MVVEHPMNYLSPGRPVSPAALQKMRDGCSRAEPGDEPGTTVYTFEARSMRDIYDRTLVVNSADFTFRVRPLAHCVCQDVRDPLFCECVEDSCHLCGASLVAMTISCSDQGCLYDDCPLCRHYREGCGYETIRDGVFQEASKCRTDYPDETLAASFIHGVSVMLGAGSGEAPDFPVSERIIEESLGEFGHAKREEGEWRYRDGSHVVRSPDGAWLVHRD